MQNRLILLLFIAAITTGCGCNNNQSNSEKEQANNISNEQSSYLVIPEPPAMLDTESEKIDYLLTNYWANYNFNDSTLARKDNFTSKPLAMYFKIMSTASQSQFPKYLSTLVTQLESADTVIFDKFTSLTEDLLYDPNSPIRCEIIYYRFTELLSKSKRVDNLVKDKYQQQRVMISKNQPGKQASNFTFTLKSGGVRSLYDLDADYLLLMFYHPDCHTCAETIAELKNSPFFTHKELKILAIFPERDEKLWRDKIGMIPEEWICGFDKTGVLVAKKLYDLRPSPSLYLLDKKKSVILKDARLDEIAGYLAGAIK